jgi:hypothetical protein
MTTGEKKSWQYIAKDEKSASYISRMDDFAGESEWSLDISPRRHCHLLNLGETKPGICK